MRKAWFLSLLVLFLSVCSVHAADLVATAGTPNSSGVYTMQVDSDRVVTVADDAGFKLPYEVAITSDTITAAETGKTFSVTTVKQGYGDYVTMTLPTAAVGSEFTFIADTKTIIYLDPAAADTIRYGSAVFAAGDKIGNSSAATGDSITLFCPVATYWSVKAVNGTWADAN
jgi:hypothetical protein